MSEASNSWHVARGGQTYGPYAWEQLTQMAAAGNLAATDMIWNEGMSGWTQAASIPGLSFTVAQAPPPPPMTAMPVSYYTPPRALPGSADLEALDWLLIIFCSGIACIIGLIRVIQGKPNGGKMLGFSILSMIIWSFIRIVFMHM